MSYKLASPPEVYLPFLLLMDVSPFMLCCICPFFFLRLFSMSVRDPTLFVVICTSLACWALESFLLLFCSPVVPYVGYSDAPRL